MPKTNEKYGKYTHGTNTGEVIVTYGKTNEREWWKNSWQEELTEYKKNLFNETYPTVTVPMTFMDYLVGSTIARCAEVARNHHCTDCPVLNEDIATAITSLNKTI